MRLRDSIIPPSLISDFPLPLIILFNVKNTVYTHMDFTIDKITTYILSLAFTFYAKYIPKACIVLWCDHCDSVHFVKYWNCVATCNLKKSGLHNIKKSYIDLKTKLWCLHLYMTGYFYWSGFNMSNRVGFKISV